MDYNETVVLVNHTNSLFVQSLKDRLEQFNIPSVHIAGHTNSPMPIGLKVRSKDLDRAKSIMLSVPSESDKGQPKSADTIERLQVVGSVILIFGVIAFFIFDSIKFSI